jgi:hypothetical protein
MHEGMRVLNDSTHAVVGPEHESDARRFLDEMRERLKKVRK